MSKKTRPSGPPFQPPTRGSFRVPADMTAAAALRAAMPGASWNVARGLCEKGKVSVADNVIVDSASRLAAGSTIAWDMLRKDPARTARAGRVTIVFEDAQLIVIDKPSGISSVPYDRKETDTAMDAIRDAWRAQGRKATEQPLYIVHRIDKDTSGLLCFAKTKAAERALHLVFKQHLAERTYLAVAHGEVAAMRIESYLIANRGDGLRGSSKRGAVGSEGQHAVTHVFVERHLQGATLCRVKLETGRTHQIRIHLAERKHPLVGETVYIRDLRRDEAPEIACPRLLLHAATLGLPHPTTAHPLAFASPLPQDFRTALGALEGNRP